MQKDIKAIKTAKEDFLGDCTLFKMAEGLYVCETSGPCPFSITFADKKLCKNSLVIAQYQN